MQKAAKGEQGWAQLPGTEMLVRAPGEGKTWVSRTWMSRTVPAQGGKAEFPAVAGMELSSGLGFVLTKTQQPSGQGPCRQY